MAQMETRASLSRRFVPTLAVLGVTAATLSLLLVPAYFIGKKWEDGRHFLKNYRVPDQFEVSCGLPMEYALGSSEENDVIILGDSAGRTGIDSKYFEDLTTLRAYNLASMGEFGLDSYIFTFRAYLKHHPKPRVVVLCLSPEILEFPPAPFVTELRSRFFWCFGDGAEETRPVHVNPLQYYIRQGGWISYGYATGGVERYKNEASEHRFVGTTYNALSADVKARRGFDLQPGLHGPKRGLRGKGLFTVAAYNREQLHVLARLTQEDGILLLIRLAPICSEESAKNFDDVKPCFAELEGQYSNVRISRPELLWYDEGLCWEVLHLNAKGATVFTALVAEEVRDVLKKQ